MIVKVWGAPSLTRAEFNTYCALHSIPHVKSVARGQINLSGEEQPTSFLPVYVSGLKQLNEYSAALTRSPLYFIVLVVDYALLLLENGLEVLNTDATDTGFVCQPLSVNDFLSVVTRQYMPDWLPLKFREKTAQRHSIMEAIIDASSLHLVQPLIYRVPKDNRNLIQQAVFLYLAGSIKTIGPAGNYPFLVNALSHVKLQRLRQACELARKTSIDAAVTEMEVDRFEVQYLFSRLGLLD